MTIRTIQEHYVSAIVPTFNARELLPRLLRQLGPSRLVREIVVVDGGSADDTVAIARAMQARVTESACGRGTQLAAGARQASAPWLLFLHADSELIEGWEATVGAFVTTPAASERAGYFDLLLDAESPAARRLERLVAWRCRRLALPFGDQGLLISRALYDHVGGFAGIPLMEDVELIRRLGRHRLLSLKHPIRSSARKYERDGYLLRPMRNLLCLSLYLSGVPPERIVPLYR